MLLVKTRVGTSKIEGLGLFAAEFIKKGKDIWRFMPGFDLMIHKDFMEYYLSDETVRQIKHYGHREGDLYYLDSDDGRFFNSVPNPNTEAIDPNGILDGSKQMIPNHYVVMVAARDIQEGEEITCNYGEFDDDFKDKKNFDAKESRE